VGPTGDLVSRDVGFKFVFDANDSGEEAVFSKMSASERAATSV